MRSSPAQRLPGPGSCGPCNRSRPMRAPLRTDSFAALGRSDARNEWRRTGTPGGKTPAGNPRDPYVRLYRQRRAANWRTPPRRFVSSEAVHGIDTGKENSRDSRSKNEATSAKLERLLLILVRVLQLVERLQSRPLQQLLHLSRTDSRPQPD